MYEQLEFEKWLTQEKINGLIDFKVYPINTDTAEKEHIYAELNAMNRALTEKNYTQIFDL